MEHITDSRNGGALKGEILEWLGTDGKRSYYLALLSPQYTKSPEALIRLKDVAQRLAQLPEQWDGLVSGQVGVGWRTNLVAAYALLIAQNKDHGDALVESLERKTWVSPQIAVTLGLLHPEIAIAYFSELLTRSDVAADPKRTAAAYQILSALGSSAAAKFNYEAFAAHPPPPTAEAYSANSWDSYWRMDCTAGFTIAEAHWEAWKNILPLTLYS